MRHVLIFLACIALSVGIVHAAEERPSGDVPRAESRTDQQQREDRGNAPPSMTPGKIRSFLSSPVKEDYIILNFDSADLKDVINTIASITDENFILSPGLDARITIHSAKKIPVSEVLHIFESVLEVNGMSLVRSGEFYKIVSGTTAKQRPLEVIKSREAGTVGDLDRPVTQIIPVDYVPVTEVSTVLTPMLSQFGSIIPNPRNNLIIVNDLSSNIVRLLKVLKEIDVNAFKNTRMAFFKPRYSDVSSLSNELTEVLNALNLSREGIALVPIERINSIVIFSASQTLLKTIEGWVRKLDEEVMTGQNVFVYPVQNVKAEKIAEILKSLYGESGGGKTAAAPAQSAAKKAKNRRMITRAINTGKTATSRIEIITFEPTNSLIILSPPGIYREMVETIKRIDTYPREVLIEAVIAEVSLSDSDQYGIQWSVLHDLKNNVSGLGQQTLGSAPALSSEAPSLGDGPSSGISYLVFEPDRLTAMVHALAAKSKVNILSSPRLLVRDQEEASIEVGSDIPTATSTTSATTTDTLTQNIEYRTVGIKLNIKPTISEERTVVLDLEQEVSSTGDNVTVGAQGTTFPSFNTTKTKTSIIVPDKQGIVIGGIIEEENNKSYEGIPLLSSIPILGNLFRYTADRTSKKELVIIITPHVVSSKAEADVLTNDFLDKLKELKGFLKEEESEVDVPGMEGTQSPQANES